MVEIATPGSGDEPKMSWLERETLNALHRLATARANLAALEERAAGDTNRAAAADPADVARAGEIHAEIEKLRPKTTSRFGGGGARDRIEELEFQERLILERLGFATYEELVAERDKPVAAVPSVDPMQLDLARREVEAADKEWLEITAFELPPNEDESDADDDEGAAPARAHLEIVEPPAAS